ncbi:hypothetical protein QVD17_38623 [Tagetes erecta]|uniref:Uncharacterized protein n=1 Tax=Tagetes erecta TaxID=13708 RepID=A0AAD8NGE2_TARER|nr:hypothetical protein QVD17_38623 [Tagetes erecta]
MNPMYAKLQLSRIAVLVNVCQCYVHVLNMPVLGYAMKRITLGEVGFEDKMEAALHAYRPNLFRPLCIV